HVRARPHLCVDVGDDRREIARGHLGGELLPAGRVDPFPDDRERSARADDVLAGCAGNDRVDHDYSSADGRTASASPATSAPPLYPPARIATFRISSVHSASTASSAAWASASRSSPTSLRSIAICAV